MELVDIGAVLYAIAVLAVIDLALIVSLMIGRRRGSIRVERRGEAAKRTARILLSPESPQLLWETFRSDPRGFLRIVLAAIRRIQIPSRIRSELNAVVREAGYERRARRFVFSRSVSRRKIGVRLLSLLPWERRIELLDEAFNRESRWFMLVRLYAFHLQQGIRRALPRAHEVFADAPRFWQDRIIALLRPHAPRVGRWLARVGMPSDAWGRRLAVCGLPAVDRDIARRYLATFLDAGDDEALDAYRRYHPELLASDALFRHRKPEVRKAHTVARLRSVTLRDIETWKRYLGDAVCRAEAENALLRALTPSVLDDAVRLYQSLHDTPAGVPVACALEGYVPYLLSHGVLSGDLRSPRGYGSALDSNHGTDVALVRDLVANGRRAAFFRFANRTAGPAELSRWKDEVYRLRNEFPGFDRDCRMYLSSNARTALGVPDQERIDSAPKIPLRWRERAYLWFLGIATVVLVPVLFAVFAAPVDTFAGLTGVTAVAAAFSYFYQQLFVYYVLAINGLYLLLLLLSAWHVRLARRRQAIGEDELLFVPGLLPSVSIVAPAFNEEQSIIDSVQSLLSLRYPAVDVVVVNDGSSDATRERMVEAFGMEPADVPTELALDTAPVLGVYRSASHPNLSLVDKANGGKADSLNAGISLASGEYICGIDADSLLEPDALLRMMCDVLESDVETVALAGNIMPVNGSRVVSGTLDSVAVSKRFLPAVQTIEYLRAFLGGRMGWARLRALLIISGAFGAFRRERVIEIGGYLTGTGRLRRDTVGEDMELVVRLRRYLYEQRSPHRVSYVHRANCWTEVPSTFGNLLKQRDRWQRGLIDNMTFHRRMLANPRYGAAGMLGFPYFYAFEMLGPFLEAGGYAVVLVSALLGLVFPATLLLLLVASVGLGILISLSSLVIASRSVVTFRSADLIRLGFVAIVENFGYRQFTAVWRAWSYARYLVRDAGWAKLKRTGFKG